MPHALLLLAVLTPSPAAAQRDPCGAVRCSGRGVCIAEAAMPTCLCDDGYEAEDLECVRAARGGRGRPSGASGVRIVDVALGELGRNRGEVGVGVDALAAYLRPHEMWCSDFVSWVYRGAGVPFSGGYHGGWHVRNNYAIRAWFQRRGLWVSRQGAAWASFEPRPGDYVRVHTSRWGHSAIVRAVEGEVLHTIDGNVGGRVRVVRRPRFRVDPRIDGFGIATDAPRRVRDLAEAARWRGLDGIRFGPARASRSAS